MTEVHDRPGRGAVANGISSAVVRLMREYTGRGPTKARTVIGRDTVTVILADTMTKAERKLAESSKSELVLQVRQQFQRTMREDLVAAVEMLMERKVIAFMSDNHIDPDMAAEIFVLEPLPDGTDSDVDNF
jgi:uncharacterized protein YbcI